jgi:hypothetical protein
MDDTTYHEATRRLGADAMRRMQASIDPSVPTGVVEQRALGQPAVRMSVDSFVRRTRNELAQLGNKTTRARRKQERQNRKRGRG